MTGPTEGVRLAPDALRRNARASALVRQGLTLLDDGGIGDAAAALTCFERALSIRVALPIAASPWLQYDLAGTWLNRADALIRLSPAGAAGLDVLGSFDAAIQLLENLPRDGDPRIGRRLAIGYQNRGLAHRALGAAGRDAAIRDFIRAIDVLERQTGEMADRPLLLAAIWVNVADAQASAETADAWRRGIQSAEHARRLVESQARSSLSAAEITLKALHVNCQALARCVSTCDASVASLVAEDVHAATDAAEAGLDLALWWRRRGVTSWRDIPDDLFRFGIEVYSAFQPQFVSEFADDYLEACSGSGPEPGT